MSRAERFWATVLVSLAFLFAVLVVCELSCMDDRIRVLEWSKE